MKKNKFNIKLTACLVSLFIGLLLVIIGNKNTYCLGFGLMLLGIGTFLYSLYKTEQSRELQQEVDYELENYDSNKEEHVAIVKELKRIKTADSKQTKRINFSFVLFAIMLFVLGIIVCL